MRIKLQPIQQYQQCSFCVPHHELDRNERNYYHIYTHTERTSGFVLDICSKCLIELKLRIVLALEDILT